MMGAEEISVFGLAGLLLLGAFITALLWAIRRFLPFIVSFRQGERMFRLWFLRAETLIWTLYLVGSLYLLFQWIPLFTLLMLALVLIPFWPFWNDFAPGLLFRIEGIADPGDLLIYEGETCSLESEGIRHLRFKTADGNILLLPYHRLKEIVFSQTSRKGKTNDHSFPVRCPGMSREEAINTLNRLILESPWSLPSKSVRIQVGDDDSYRVTIAAIDGKVAEKLRRSLQRNVNALCSEILK